MSSEMIERFMKSLTSPKNYGQYQEADTRADVAAFLARRCGDDKDTLVRAMLAIKEAQPLRWGPPDVAQTKQALKAYEEEYGVSIRYQPPGQKYTLPTREESVEAYIDLGAKAKAIGIDTSANGWIAAYFLAIIGQRAGTR